MAKRTTTYEIKYDDGSKEKIESTFTARQLEQNINTINAANGSNVTVETVTPITATKDKPTKK